MIASLDAPYSGLKAVRTDEGNINFVMNCLAYPNGTAYNEALAPEPETSGRLYGDIFVRHWDTYLTSQRFAAFGGTLVGRANSTSGYASLPLVNLLKDIPAPLTRPETPWQPFGDQGDYDISPDGTWVAFLSKAPELPKANYTASYIFLVPHDGSAVAYPINGPTSNTKPEAAKGASSSPRFSPDGRSLAYLQMDGISYEADRNKIYIADLSTVSLNTTTITQVANDWDRSPDSIVWSPDSTQFWVPAQNLGATSLFVLPITAGVDYIPANVTDLSNSVAAAYALADGISALVSSSSISSSRDFYTTTTTGVKKLLFSATTTDPELAGLGQHTVDQFYVTGALDIPIQSWVVKPSNFQSNRTYPLAFIVHGGPQSANVNGWSTRWNLQVWADQGYVVVAPNPVGSTGFGQYLTDMIQNNWGSYPYEDLVNVWEYVAANLSYVDVENGIEAGASYGGFMTNWIQGHDLGRKFKALVTHDGVTSTLNQYTTEELWFMQHDFNGTLWANRENYERWDPIRHAVNFSTPHFVIHNENDYRLPVSEGIFLFNVLQELGVPSRFLNFPDENHWVLNRANSLVSPHQRLSSDISN